VLVTFSVLVVVVIAAISSHTGKSTTPGLQPIFPAFLMISDLRDLWSGLQGFLD
jgi:uncharacterized membrane protein (GlpM family)